MTDELTKTFFDTFGIEPKLKYYCPSCNTELEKWLDSEGIYYRCGNHPECDYFLDVQSEDFEECLNCLNFKITYPQITDSIYLELICIQNKFSHPYNFYGETLGFLKNDILGLFIETEEFFRENELTVHESFKSEVRTLFEEEQQNDR